MTREQQMQDMMTAAFWRDIEEGNQPDNRDAIEIAKTYERAYQQGWRDADQHPHWIPVEERKPPIAYHDDLSENHLVVDSDGELLIAYYDAKNELWFSVDSNPKIYDVTHWMPMPQAPRKED